MLQVGSVVRFRGYAHNPQGYTGALRPGDLLLIIGVKPGDEFRCLRIWQGAADPRISELIFLEEIEPDALLIAA